MPTLDLFQHPKQTPPEALADATAIIVDLLRASTTICTALAAGAECVMPFAEIDETLAAAERYGRNRVLLGGERGGKLIPGFDLGNSPAEYTPERVAGRRILFTTTNGARALAYARHARRVLVGAAVNRTAVAAQQETASNLVVLCAGIAGGGAREDTLAGGAIVEAVLQQSAAWTLGHNASAALADWRQLAADARTLGRPLEEHFADDMRDTQGGRNLIDIGQDDDLARCAQLDVLAVVPELNPTTGELRPA